VVIASPTHPVDLPTPQLAVIVVNYNAWDDVARLVESLAGSPEVAAGHCELIVVDNASDEPAPAGLTRPRPGVRRLDRPENGGFAAGVNAGWRATRAPWLLVLNPDVIAEPDFLGRVLRRIVHHESRPNGPPGVVGFALKHADGSPQPSVGTEPGLARMLREAFIPRSRRKYQPGWRTRAGAVPWVTGACLLIDAAVLGELGGMDEDFFLYYEEVALCRSARRLGWRVEFDPAVALVHLRPLQDRPVSPKLRVITRHSKMLYFRKHLPHREFVGLSWIVALEARARANWSRLRGRRDDRRAWTTIGRMARAMRSGESIRGRAVLRMAEGVDPTDLKDEI
jgi:N-acetylglucosaminyl-diphospho-decaprenol L-rhamnosyltransferase